MRMWSYQLIPYLPDAQFRSQLRELVLILHDWRDRGTTNHLLINKVMDYPKAELTKYFMLYDNEYQKRYGKFINRKYLEEFVNFAPTMASVPIYEGWHNKEYLRICLSNLYEKHAYAKGKSRITDKEWQRLVAGYRYITNEKWSL